MGRQVKTPNAKSELAPTGVLRAGINLSNPLLVTGRTAAGDPTGVAPDVASAIADRLGVPITFVPFTKPSLLADACGKNVWDIGLIGAEPTRAQTIAFTAAYVEIEATYMVPSDSLLQSVEEVDRPGVRIAAPTGTAFDPWLTENIRHATLLRSESSTASFQRFVDEKLDVLAGLKVTLQNKIGVLPGARILPGRFTTVQQAVGVARTSDAGAAFLRDFIEEAKASGLIAELIERHSAKGLTVAPSA